MARLKQPTINVLKKLRGRSIKKEVEKEEKYNP